MSRRDVLRYAAAATPAVLGMSALSAVVGTAAGTPQASAAPLGVLLDYAAGVISAADLRASGAVGAIRYVSDRRPGGAWMLGKPIQLPEARDLYQQRPEDRVLLPVRQAGQRGLARRSDRRRPTRPAGLAVARRRGWLLSRRRSTPRSTTTRRTTSTSSQVAPYLRGWESVLGHQRVGVYANSKTIEWALQDGLGFVLLAAQLGLARAGSPIPAAHLHQVEIDKRRSAGVGVDVNHILKPSFGQWD